MVGKTEVENTTTYVGVGWISKSKDGQEFISCKLNKETKAITEDFVMFLNTRKRKDHKDPDYNIVLSKKK
jgi:uncharacterized protein (DUF736 family)